MGKKHYDGHCDKHYKALKRLFTVAEKGFLCWIGN